MANGPDNFQLVELPLPEAREGQVLSQTLWLSLDSYMRGLMDDRESYTSGVKLGHAMQGDAVSRVVESNYEGLAKDDLVVVTVGGRNWEYWECPG